MTEPTGLSNAELLDLFDRCEAHPAIRQAIRETLDPAAPAVTETDLRAAANVCGVKWSQGGWKATCRLDASHQTPHDFSVNEAFMPPKFSRGVAVERIAETSVSIDAFLASPQAAEELARAVHSMKVDIGRACYHGPLADTGSYCGDDAAALLAAWQKVRHPEE